MAPRRKKRDHPHVVQRVQRRMLQQGLGVIDGRTRLGQHLKEMRKQLIEEVGGATAAPSHIAMVDIAVRTRLLLDSIDGYVLQLGDRIVNKRKKSLYPLIEQRGRIADSLTSQLTKINEMRQMNEIEKRIEELEAQFHV